MHRLPRLCTTALVLYNYQAYKKIVTKIVEESDMSSCEQAHIRYA